MAERKHAVILESEAEKWFKVANGQFLICYNWDCDHPGDLILMYLGLRSARSEANYFFIANGFYRSYVRTREDTKSKS